jgi:hypothetical protein
MAAKVFEAALVISAPWSAGAATGIECFESVVALKRRLCRARMP